MKPREELRDKIWVTVTHNGYSLKDKAQIIEKHTDQLAIGRWVSVEERLPEFDGGYWPGFIMRDDGVVICGIWYKRFLLADKTYWLEMDLPKGGAE